MTTPMEATPGGILLRAGEGEHLARGRRSHRILAELPQLEVVELRFGPEFDGVKPHTHPNHVDSFYVLEGEAEFTLGGESFRVGPGTWVAAPTGVVHGFQVVGDSELRILNVQAPNVGFAELLRRA